jgi:nucleotide-binding universal stress UspA family protein
MLDYAVQIASLYGSSLDVLHVMERPPYVALNTVDMLSLSDATLPERRTERRIRAFLDRCQASPGETRIHVKHGEPAGAIDAFARSRRSDLVVLPTHGTSRPSQRPMGTVAGKLARRLDTSLLLIPSHAVSVAPSYSGPSSSEEAPAP